MSINLPAATYSSTDQVVEVARAAETLARIFPDYDIEFRPRKVASSGPPKTTPSMEKRPRDKGNRSKVIGATKERHLTIEQIANETGLDQKQVRGVVNAPTLNFEKVAGSNGATAYKFVSAGHADE